MKLFKTIWLRLRSLWQRCEVKREIDEETALPYRAAHGGERRRRHGARKRRARHGSGSANLQSVREECRERRGASFGEGDLGRMCASACGFCGKIPDLPPLPVPTLALGIGANTAIFSSIKLGPAQTAALSSCRQLVDIAEQMPESRDRYAVSGGAFKDWREHSSKFAHLAIYEGIDRNLTGKGTPGTRHWDAGLR